MVSVKNLFIDLEFCEFEVNAFTNNVYVYKY